MPSPAPRPRIRAVLFDLDGTLVDSEPAWCRAKEIVAARHGRPITKDER